MRQEAQSARRKALVSIINAVAYRAANTSSKIVLYTSALGAATLTIANIDANTLPPTLSFYLAGIGIEAFGLLLDRLTSDTPPNREESLASVDHILNESNIHEALKNPDFVREFAETFTATCLQLIRQSVLEGEGDLALEIMRELTGTHLLQKEFEQHAIQIMNLLSKADQKRDEQYDDVVRRLDTLLQLSSFQSVLSLHPKSKRPLMDIPLIGREEDFKWLIWRAERLQDCLLVGQPGSGKTFLFRKLTDSHNALFVVGHSRRELELTLLSVKPSIVMLDDVHVNLELLRDIRQIRENNQLQFAIFANCWPSKKSQIAVEMALTDEDINELSLLSRDDIVSILAAIDVEEPWAVVFELVNQSEGRPGLAVSLAELYRKGGYKEIFSGEAIANHLLETYIKDDVRFPYTEEILVLSQSEIGG